MSENITELPVSIGFHINNGPTFNEAARRMVRVTATEPDDTTGTSRHRVAAIDMLNLVADAAGLGVEQIKEGFGEKVTLEELEKCLMKFELITGAIDDVVSNRIRANASLKCCKIGGCTHNPAPHTIEP